MPQPSDYNEAVQALNSSKFTDNFIRSSSIAELDSNRLPASYSGNFACVYKIKADVTAGGGMWALRFFININGQTAARYRAIQTFLQATPCPFFVGFDFQDKAVFVSGNWYPLVKMPWIEGHTLDKYVKDNLRNPHAISVLATEFAQMIAALKSRGIAHGDLQHGNIIVSPTGIKLIDYDGLYCAATESIPSNEVGMPNYQHPGRTAANFGPDVDDFSAWIIFISLTLISKDTKLFNDNETLIFEKSDFESPRSSARLKAIATHHDPSIRALGGFIVHNLLPPKASEVPKFSHAVDPIATGAGRVPAATWWTKASSETTVTAHVAKTLAQPLPPMPRTVLQPTATSPYHPATATTSPARSKEFAYWAKWLGLVLISSVLFATLPLLALVGVLKLIAEILGLIGASREILAWAGALLGLLIGVGVSKHWVGAIIGAFLGAFILSFISYWCGQGAGPTSDFAKGIWANWATFVAFGGTLGCGVGVLFASAQVKR
jgi:serine/threonine protein kinase